MKKVMRSIKRSGSSTCQRRSLRIGPLLTRPKRCCSLKRMSPKRFRRFQRPQKYGKRSLVKNSINCVCSGASYPHLKKRLWRRKGTKNLQSMRCRYKGNSRAGRHLHSCGFCCRRRPKGNRSCSTNCCRGRRGPQ